MIFQGKDVKICNVYPYIIDTELFSGFSGKALWLMSALKVQDVAAKIVQAILEDSEEVYLPWYAYWLGIGMIVLRGFSERLRVLIIQFLMGDGMTTLRRKKD